MTFNPLNASRLRVLEATNSPTKYCVRIFSASAILTLLSGLALAQAPINKDHSAQNRTPDKQTRICFAQLQWGMNMTDAMRSLRDFGYKVPELEDPNAKLPEDLFTITGTLWNRPVKIVCYFGTDELHEAGLQKVEVALLGLLEEENKTAFRDLKEIMVKKYGSASVSNLPQGIKASVPLRLRQDLKPGVPVQQARWKTPRAFSDSVAPDTFDLELVIAGDEPLRINYFGPKWPLIKKQKEKLLIAL